MAVPVQRCYIIYQDMRNVWHGRSQRTQSEASIQIEWSQLGARTMSPGFCPMSKRHLASSGLNLEASSALSSSRTSMYLAVQKRKRTAQYSAVRSGRHMRQVHRHADIASGAARLCTGFD